jgi:hypothetical protein
MVLRSVMMLVHVELRVITLNRKAEKIWRSRIEFDPTNLISRCGQLENPEILSSSTKEALLMAAIATVMQPLNIATLKNPAAGALPTRQPVPAIPLPELALSAPVSLGDASVWAATYITSLVPSDASPRTILLIPADRQGIRSPSTAQTDTETGSLRGY